MAKKKSKSKVKNNPHFAALGCIVAKEFVGTTESDVDAWGAITCGSTSQYAHLALIDLRYSHVKWSEMHANVSRIEPSDLAQSSELADIVMDDDKFMEVLNSKKFYRAIRKHFASINADLVANKRQYLFSVSKIQAGTSISEVKLGDRVMPLNGDNIIVLHKTAVRYSEPLKGAQVTIGECVEPPIVTSNGFITK